jgi:GNAT superfamily N-acetyltransferase
VSPPSPAPGWVIELEDVGAPDSRELLHAYYVELSHRWFQRLEGRDATAEELEQGEPLVRSDDLAPPGGAFLVARRDAEAGGCVGVRRGRGASGERVAELRRMYVRPDHRGTALAPNLLACAEEVAVALGAAVIRLDTRRDLVEARALYASHGFREVAPFNTEPFAEVWMAKELT